MRISSVYLFAFFITFACQFTCIAQERYTHKPEKEIAKMTPAQKIEEIVKEKYYHRSYHETESLLRDYILKDGVRAFSALADIADRFDPNTASEYEVNRVFDAFHLAKDIDNAAVRARGTKEGRRLISSIQDALNRLENAEYPSEKAKAYRKYIPVELDQLRTLKGKKGVPTDGNILRTLDVKYNIRVSREEMKRFSDFLTSRDPTYPSRCKLTGRVNRLVCEDSKEYFDAILVFRSEVAFKGFCTDVPNVPEFTEIAAISTYPRADTELGRSKFSASSDRVKLNIYLISELCFNGGGFRTFGRRDLVAQGKDLVVAIALRMEDLKNWNALNSLSKLLVDIDKDCNCLKNDPLLLDRLEKIFQNPPGISDHFENDYFDEFRSNISKLKIEDSSIKSSLSTK